MSKFGIKHNRYVNYRVVLVDEMAIRFSSNLAQESSVSYSQVHVTFDTSLALLRWPIPQFITAANSPFLPSNTIFYSPSNKLL